MHQKNFGSFLTSIEEKERVYHSELIRHGVNYEEAVQAAKIIASEKPNELLTPEETELVKEVCTAWLLKHKSYKHLNPLLMKFKQVE
ncbi:MAG: hypothetical protein KME32_21910 [Mojavia pulchra JT2-VF2]|jgi:hypothetical protein|uniref:Uncharacterized protein n=1 Tax=Mojavia pulchra JT2-VF2 TaxID=287848 RepID=A0A951UIV6_9NOST|nr:hypothetical protein [Mojavia pulchra JT2-VF2]